MKVVTEIEAFGIVKSRPTSQYSVALVLIVAISENSGSRQGLVRVFSVPFLSNRVMETLVGRSVSASLGTMQRVSAARTKKCRKACRWLLLSKTVVEKIEKKAHRREPTAKSPVPNVCVPPP